MDICNVSFKTNIIEYNLLSSLVFFHIFITNLYITKVIFCINTMNYKDLMEEY
jgi:hypothetical protein